MRLTCPNCEAQYEVPDEVIPTSGRDVQCSNCGDTWFEHHPDHPPAEAEPEEDQTWDASQEPADSEPDVEPETHSEPESDAEPDPEEDAEPASERRELDPAVKDVLREEADLERAHRDKEGGLETQPDLGLETREDETEKRSREAQARMARLRGEPDGSETPEHPDPDPGTRRNLLPDIDEINSSLSSDQGDSRYAADPGEVEVISTEKSGFRRGFTTVLLLAVIGLLLYMFAPQLADMVPALKGALMSYVDIVDYGRSWLSSTVGGLMGTLDGMSSENN